MMTQIKDLDNIIYKYVYDLEQWEKYKEIIGFFEHIIENHAFKFKSEENEFDLEAWLFYKNSQLYKYNIDPAVFETEVELYFKIDFELMLLNTFPK